MNCSRSNQKNEYSLIEPIQTTTVSKFQKQFFKPTSNNWKLNKNENIWIKMYEKRKTAPRIFQKIARKVFMNSVSEFLNRLKFLHNFFPEFVSNFKIHFKISIPPKIVFVFL